MAHTGRVEWVEVIVLPCSSTWYTVLPLVSGRHRNSISVLRMLVVNDLFQDNPNKAPPVAQKQRRLSRAMVACTEILCHHVHSMDRLRQAVASHYVLKSAR